MQSRQCLPFFFFSLLLPRAAGILSWASHVIRADPLIPPSPPSPHLGKRSTLEKCLPGRLFTILGGFSATAHITPTSSTGLGGIRLGTGSCTAQEAGCLMTFALLRPEDCKGCVTGVPEDRGGDGRRRWQLRQWRMDENVCFDQGVE